MPGGINNSGQKMAMKLYFTILEFQHWLLSIICSIAP